MRSRQKRALRPLAAAELAAVLGGVMLIPAVQKIRDTVTPLAAGTIFLKFDPINGDATER